MRKKAPGKSLSVLYMDASEQIPLCLKLSLETAGTVPNNKFSYRKAEIQNIFEPAGTFTAAQGFGCNFYGLDIQPPKDIHLNVHLLPVLLKRPLQENIGKTY